MLTSVLPSLISVLLPFFFSFCTYSIIIIHFSIAALYVLCVLYVLYVLCVLYVLYVLCVQCILYVLSVNTVYLIIPMQH